MIMKVASSNESNTIVNRKIDMRKNLEKAKSLSFIKEENDEIEKSSDTTEKIDRDCGSVNDVNVEEDKPNIG